MRKKDQSLMEFMEETEEQVNSLLDELDEFGEKFPKDWGNKKWRDIGRTQIELGFLAIRKSIGAIEYL